MVNNVENELLMVCWFKSHSIVCAFMMKPCSIFAKNGCFEISFANGWKDVVNLL